MLIGAVEFNGGLRGLRDEVETVCRMCGIIAKFDFTVDMTSHVVHENHIGHPYKGSVGHWKGSIKEKGRSDYIEAYCRPVFEALAEVRSKYNFITHK